MGEKGVAVIMAMWLLAVLAIIGTTFIFMMRLEPIIARTHRDDMKAMYITQAGIDHAVYWLRRDTDLTIDSLKEDWATYFSGSDVDNDGDGTADSKWITLTDEDGNTFGYYAVIINDEGGKVSLNNPLADNSSWKNLLDGLPNIGTIKVNNIVNYQKETYGPFETLDELACVYDISEESLSVYHQVAKVYHKEFPTNPDTRLPINVNTANEKALKAAFGRNQSGTPGYAILKVTETNIDRVVTAILAYRAGADGIERTADDNPFDGIDTNRDDDNSGSETDSSKPFNIQDIDLNPPSSGSPAKYYFLDTWDDGTLDRTNQDEMGSAQDEFNEFINYVRKWGYPNTTAVRIAEKSITNDYVRDNIKDNFDPDAETEYDNWDSNNPTTPDVNDDDADFEILAADKTYTTNFSFNNSPTGPPQSHNNQFFEIISTGRYVSPSGQETLKRIRIIINRGKATPAVKGKIWYYREIPED